MSVVASWICGTLKEPDTLATSLQGDALDMLKESIFQNTNGSVFVPKDGGAPEVSGSPTESAVLWFGVKVRAEKHSIYRVTGLDSTLSALILSTCCSNRCV